MRFSRPTFPAKGIIGSCFNSGHPLAANMKFLLLLNEGGGLQGTASTTQDGLCNLVTGRRGTYVVGSGSSHIAFGARQSHGPSILPANSGDKEYLNFTDAGDLTVRTQLTFGVVAVFFGDAFTNFVCVGKYDATTNIVWDIGNRSSSTAISGRVTGGSGTGAQAISSQVSNNGVPHLYLWTWDGTTLTAYLDGLKNGSSTPTVGTLSEDAAKTIKVSGFQNAGNTNWRAPIYAVYLWDRVLSANDVQWLWQEPYNNFIVPVRRRFTLLPETPPATSVFRRSLSDLGTRVGSRQMVS